MDSVNNEILLNNLNSIKLVFYEAREVKDFYWRGRNRLSFNRIFVIFDENNTEESWIKSSKSQEKIIMKANHIYFMACDQEFEFSFAHNIKFISFHFNIILSNWYDLFVNSNKFCEIKKTQEWIEHIKEIFHSPKINKSFELKNCLSNEIMQLLPSELSFPKQENSYSIKLFEYIEKNLSAQLTVNELAHNISMSADTLSKKFHLDFDMTLKEAIKRKLSAAAEYLLLNPNFLIKDVAQKLKFNDEYYFSKFFKRETGMSPSEFRQQHLNKNTK